MSKSQNHHFQYSIASLYSRTFCSQVFFFSLAWAVTINSVLDIAIYTSEAVVNISLILSIGIKSTDGHIQLVADIWTPEDFITVLNVVGLTVTGQVHHNIRVRTGSTGVMHGLEVTSVGQSTDRILRELITIVADVLSQAEVKLIVLLAHNNSLCGWEGCANDGEGDKGCEGSFHWEWWIFNWNIFLFLIVCNESLTIVCMPETRFRFSVLVRGKI